MTARKRRILCWQVLRPGPLLAKQYPVLFNNGDSGHNAVVFPWRSDEGATKQICLRVSRLPV